MNWGIYNYSKNDIDVLENFIFNNYREGYFWAILLSVYDFEDGDDDIQPDIDITENSPLEEELSSINRRNQTVNEEAIPNTYDNEFSNAFCSFNTLSKDINDKYGVCSLIIYYIVTILMVFAK